MAAAHNLRYASAPSVWGLYPRVLLARKAKHVREGTAVPRLEARLERVTIDARHLAQYRALCGSPQTDELPPAYPHVLAMSMHMALLSSDTFPVQLLGLVHVANRIEQLRPVRAQDAAALRTYLEGHRDTERGQEFDLHTELADADGAVIWREVCTFLARRRGRRKSGEEKSSPAARPEVAAEPAHAPVRSTSFHADAGIGRRYGWVSGDVNPIHLADLTARAFGFDRAIAHGMWSLARCAAELGADAFAAPCMLEVEFKLPIFLPAWVMLQSWDVQGGTAFALRDAQGDKPHLAGRLTRGQ